MDIFEYLLIEHYKKKREERDAKRHKEVLRDKFILNAEPEKKKVFIIEN